MDTKYCIVKSSVAPLYLNPTFKSELVSQALIWESLVILDKKDNWYKIKQWDDYISWIHNSYILKSKINVKNKYNEWYYLNKTISKSNLLLSFASTLPVIDKTNDGYYEFVCPNSKKFKINKKYLISCNNKLKNKDIIKYAKSLMGTPYLWGGKSSFGYDCSGFIQTILLLKGINFPRDCSDQINSKLIEINKRDKQATGDLIYFKEKDKVNHVGMFINQHNFIHSSGEVKVNSIYKKSKYYSNKLSKLDYSIYKFKDNI